MYRRHPAIVIVAPNGCFGTSTAEPVYVQFDGDRIETTAVFGLSAAGVPGRRIVSRFRSFDPLTAREALESDDDPK